MEITHYSFGKIDIDGKRYQSDVIITSDSVKANWWRKEGHNLAIADLDDVLDDNPEVLIIGSGYYGRMQVPEVTRDFLKAKGIKVEVAPTSDAVEKFNQLQQECARIVAALHLTC